MSAHKGPLLLSAKDIVIRFNLRGQELTAIRGASLDIYQGETVALVGESGSGKSVFTKSFIGMLDQNGRVDGGSLLFHGEDLTTYTQEKQWLTVRGKRIAMVFQDPMTSLNPVRTVGEQIAEVIMWHFKKSHDAAKAEAIQWLKRVGIDQPERRYHQYPGEFSGGMRQRVVIAAAMACDPEILICDEPTTALDVTVQAQVLALIRTLQWERNMSVVFITHDLGVVAGIADWVAVMYAGEIVEYGEVGEIFHQPEHPYTQALLKSLPQLGVKGHDLYAIQGTPPSLFRDIQGDAFAPRNVDAMKIDFVEKPPVFPVSDTHWARTWLLAPEAAAYRAQLKARDKDRESLTPPEPFDYTRAETLLSVRNLTVNYRLGRSKVTAVNGVSFDIYRGETLSMVGESGSGKTTIGRAIMNIAGGASQGDILFKGQKINQKLSKKARAQTRLEMQMIFQDPMASLNDRAKVDYIVSEGLYNFHLFDSEAERVEKVESMLREVGLTGDFMTRFPHEFSGGQRQRIGIARSLIMNPEFIVADEPISALDVSIRAQVINLMNRLKKARGLTYLFIAHDLSAVRFISDRIAVIYRGRLVELAACEELFKRPLHPYTQALLSAAPYPDPDTEKGKTTLVYHPDEDEINDPALHWREVYPFHYVLARSDDPLV